jgi:TetR/AcrR family transcriptional repressor of nem operon
LPNKKTTAAPAGARAGSMRDSIKLVATELLIRHGYRGTSFRNIADRLDITTTNIHYHFGNKEKLVEEVLRDYVDAAVARHEEIWQDPEHSLEEKLAAVAKFNYHRYSAFNKDRKGNRPWSLIGRLRLDGEILGEEAKESLSLFTVRVHESIKVAVRLARWKGELRADAPLDDIALLILNIVNSSSTFTQDAGSFDRLEQFFETFSRVVLRAYASPAGK